MRTSYKWIPATILCVGLLMVSGAAREHVSMPLRAPLSTTIPTSLLGFAAQDVQISEDEQRVAGMTNYVMRMYSPVNTPEGTKKAAFSIYVGYYDRQFQGKTIHSPKNCLPGGGWEPLVASTALIATSIGEIPVNRYLIGNGQEKALVLYWYQGRGRVVANEYAVKWHLLQDQALAGRSDEALVRIIVPVVTDEAEAYVLATKIAGMLAPSVDRAVPS